MSLLLNRTDATITLGSGVYAVGEVGDLEVQTANVKALLYNLGAHGREKIVPAFKKIDHPKEVTVVVDATVHVFGVAASIGFSAPRVDRKDARMGFRGAKSQSKVTSPTVRVDSCPGASFEGSTGKVNGPKVKKVSNPTDKEMYLIMEQLWS